MAVDWYNYDAGQAPYGFEGMGDTPGTNRWLGVADNGSVGIYYDAGQWHWDADYGVSDGHGTAASLEQAKAAAEAWLASQS